MIGPPDVVKAATNLQSHPTSNVANVSQRAALAALTGGLDDVARMREAFDRRGRTMAPAPRHRGGHLPRAAGRLLRVPDVTGRARPRRSRGRKVSTVAGAGRGDPRRGQGGGRARRGVRRAGLLPPVVRPRRRRPGRGHRPHRRPAAHERPAAGPAVRVVAVAHHRRPHGRGRRVGQRAAGRRRRRVVVRGPADRGRAHPAGPAPAGGEPHDVLPEGWNARTQVHEYGGGAWRVRDGVLWFSAWADQRIHRLDVGAGQAVPQPVTPEPVEPAGPALRRRRPQPGRPWLVCVRERHGAGAEAVNEIVALPASPGADVGEPVEPASWSPAPTSSRRRGSAPTAARWLDPVGPPGHAVGRHRAVLGAVRPDGGAADARAGGRRPDRVGHPADLDAGGGLLASSDRTGWWNLYRFTGGRPVLDEPEALTPIDAEIGGPHWVFGQSWYAVLPDGRWWCRSAPTGLQSVGWSAPGTGRVERLGRRTPRSASCVPVGGRRVRDGRRRASPTSRPRCAAASRPRAPLETEALRPARDLGFDPATFSAPEPISSPPPAAHRPRPPLPADQPRGSGRPRRAAAAARAEPRRPDPRRPPDAQPRHPVLDQPGLRRGRRQLRREHRLRPAYRERLNGRGASSTSTTAWPPPRTWPPGHRRPRAAGDPGRQRRRLHDAVRARVPRHVRRRGEPLRRGRLEALARDTHKFESRYLDGLVGPYPDEVERLPRSGRRSTTPTGSPARSSSSRASRTRSCRPPRPR